MRILCVLGILAATGLLFQSQPSPAQPRQTPAPRLDEKSYGAGFFIGEETRGGLGRDGMGVDLDLVTRGFRDGLTNAAPLVTRQDMDAILRAVHQEMEKRMVQRLLEESPVFKQLHDENLRKSLAFHEVFQKQPGVETLPSGLQYKILRAGAGRSPTASDVAGIPCSRIDFWNVLAAGLSFGSRTNSVPSGSSADTTVSHRNWPMGMSSFFTKPRTSV